MHHPKDPCAKPLLHQGGKKWRRKNGAKLGKEKERVLREKKVAFSRLRSFFFAAAKS